MDNKKIPFGKISSLPNFFHDDTRDVHQHAKCLKGWRLDFLQMSEGPFEGEVVLFELEGLKIIKDRISQSVLKKGELENASISFSVPLSQPQSPLVCQGKTYQQPGVLALRKGELPEIRVPAGLELLCLSMDSRSLLGLLDGPDTGIEQSLAKPCYLPIPAGYRNLARLFELTCQSRLFHDYPAVRRELRDDFLSQLLIFLERGEVEKVTTSARKRVVDRAREVIAANEDDTMTILALCQAIGVSRRKLQYCFQDCLGVSPVTYIRLYRLNEVHKSLLNAGATTHVQDEAARRGFYHLGRFALEYRRLFGERPSETLRRAQANRAESG
ncbi:MULTISPECIES: helix-turn-helix domain-containing protein [unclassified Modicisalibacter]|uniref:helix-turn-helix domain-containing protein n=1 Tax=unclassified Modicisalibacter TaxID=2679913 RepID=UPI001CCF2816|nr:MULTISPECIES: helix-turn-helix domain-containing protein [unclassified Modicisalibacter]MBZ9558749.1 helix-turn-helix domain-containing protein [Modicisalibacter sp. R2A 31.J]MBZ9575360.1 helix-turn-helix domain-containing protein [Modicisalibacter sp. MOD 31.J]